MSLKVNGLSGRTAWHRQPDSFLALVAVPAPLPLIPTFPQRVKGQNRQRVSGAESCAESAAVRDKAFALDVQVQRLQIRPK